MESFKLVKVDVRPTQGKSEKDRIYIFINKEKIIENLQNRFSRPSKLYKEKVLPLVMKQIEKDYPDEYKKIENTKWNWNQKAGCWCGCSPGFVGNTKNKFEIFVNVNQK